MKLYSEAVRKDFPRAAKSSNYFTAVQETDLILEPGRLIEISGRSGSGKSTLLNMLAGMLKPSSGKVFLDGTDLYSLDDRALSMLRNQSIGLIPQGHTALLSLNVLENVMLPAVLYSGEKPPEEWAEQLLDLVGIAGLKNAMPNELSGGELRRLAVARAMIMRPGILLADEPTAGLDGENVRGVLRLLRSAADDGAAVLLVTHEDEVADYADHVFMMDGGRLV